jgi:hypothetical protein
MVLCSTRIGYLWLEAAGSQQLSKGELAEEERVNSCLDQFPELEGGLFRFNHPAQREHERSEWSIRRRIPELLLSSHRPEVFLDQVVVGGPSSDASKWITGFYQNASHAVRGCTKGSS